MLKTVVSGRIQCVTPNIQNIPRHYKTNEMKFQQCRTKEKEVAFRSCDRCNQRFKCWTASRPRVAITGIQQAIERQMVTVDEVSKAFDKLCYQICNEATRGNFDVQ